MPKDFMDVFGLVDEVAEMADNFVHQNMKRVAAPGLGLDERCGYLFVNADAIAIEKDRDGTLAYYGGFEYVNKRFRKELGDLVFYLGEDSRVADHIERWQDGFELTQASTQVD